MVAQARLGEKLGFISHENEQRVERLLERAKLPTKIPDYIDRKALVKKLYTDKKVRDGKLRFVFQKEIGEMMCFGENQYGKEISEEQIAEIKNKTTSDSSKKNNTEATSPFSNLSGKDFNGNPVDESLFSKNAVTVVNFWFNSCKPCVAELSKLNELNEAIRSMGGEVVGINTETFNGNKTAIKEASAILESQGAKYRNLSIDSSSNAGKYASDIMAFPTTILVDRNGNIVGDPMLGGIDNKDNYDTLMKQIKSVIAADSNSK